MFSCVDDGHAINSLKKSVLTLKLANLEVVATEKEKKKSIIHVQVM